MKLMVLSLTHNVGGSRGPVYELFCRRMAHVREKYGIETFVVGSDGHFSKDITSKWGHGYLEHLNKPVSFKWNAGMAAIRNMGADYVMTLDSDDILSDSLFEEYLDNANLNKYHFLGVTDSYFVSFHLKRAHFDKCFHWPGYKGGNVIMGCSKVLRKDVLDLIDWKIFPPDRGKSYSLNNLSSAWISGESNLSDAQRGKIKVKNNNHLHIDIKTNGNISSVAPLWKGKELLDFDSLIATHLPPEEAELWIEYRKRKLDEFAKRRR